MSTSIRPPHRAEPLPRQLAAQLRDRITDGTWPLGHRLPGEMELAGSLGVSRGTIREALRALVHTGLLEARAGDGTYVRAQSELEAVIRGQVPGERGAEIADVRAALERYGARLAAERRTATDIDNMRQALDRRDAATDGPEYIAEDTHFHAALIAATHNALFIRLHTDLGAVEAQLGGLRLAGVDLDAFRREHAESERQHRLLVDAVAEADPDAAERAVAALFPPTDFFSHPTSTAPSEPQL